MADFNDRARDLLQAGYRYALSLTHTEPDAEDLVQEAWLRLYPKKGKRITRSLLFTAIRNLFIDHYRRSKLVVFEAFDEAEHAAIDPIPERDIDPEDLDAALQGLKTEEREAIYLNVIEGYTAREIADFIQRPRGTVLSLLHRGKQKLSRKLTALIRRRERNSG